MELGEEFCCVAGRKGVNRRGKAILDFKRRYLCKLHAAMWDIEDERNPADPDEPRYVPTQVPDPDGT